MKLSDLRIQIFVLSEFGENAYALSVKGSADTVLIDPGLEPEEMINDLKTQKTNVTAILITHGHIDHIAGIPAVKAVWPNAKILIGRLEQDKLTDPNKNLSGLFGMPFKTGSADLVLDDEEIFEQAGITFKAVLLPGHSTGHMIYIPQVEGKTAVFSGDVLFKDGIGRTDFPDGSYDDLISGIQNKMYALPDETIVYCGHGPATDIGQEKQSNLWLRG